eukprot:jgi/Botrbrau1/10847/Bobra.0025s0025.1
MQVSSAVFHVVHPCFYACGDQPRDSVSRHIMVTSYDFIQLSMREDIIEFILGCLGVARDDAEMTLAPSSLRFRNRFVHKPDADAHNRMCHDWHLSLDVHMMHPGRGIVLMRAETTSVRCKASRAPCKQSKIAENCYLFTLMMECCVYPMCAVRARQRECFVVKKHGIAEVGSRSCDFLCGIRRHMQG